jgi:hypothetical protein
MVAAIIVVIIEAALFIWGLVALLRIEKIRPTKSIIPKTDKDVGKVW